MVLVSRFKSYGYSIIVAFAMLQSACYAETTIDSGFANTSENVLIGTDVKNISEFKTNGVISTGQYQAEMGGATLNVSISMQAGFFELRRIFQEPGMSQEVKTYKFKKSKSTRINTATISLAATGAGLLLLEKKSESFGVPADLWIYYSRK